MNTARQLAKMLLSKDGFNLSPSTNPQSHPLYLSFAVLNLDMKYIMVWKLLMERWLLVCLVIFFFGFDLLLTFNRSAAVYSARYISDRFLPDKAIDLVDEAASALRLAQESKPDSLEALEREIVTLQIELESLKKETDVFSVERRSKVESDLALKKEEASVLTREWQAGEEFQHIHTLKISDSHIF